MDKEIEWETLDDLTYTYVEDELSSFVDEAIAYAEYELGVDTDGNLKEQVWQSILEIVQERITNRRA